MVNMKYMSEGHTFVSFGRGEKDKVVNGEIIDVPENMVGRMQLAWFVLNTENFVVETEEDGKNKIEIEVKNVENSETNEKDEEVDIVETEEKKKGKK